MFCPASRLDRWLDDGDDDDDEVILVYFRLRACVIRLESFFYILAVRAYTRCAHSFCSVKINCLLFTISVGSRHCRNLIRQANVCFISRARRLRAVSDINPATLAQSLRKDTIFQQPFAVIHCVLSTASSCSNMRMHALW